MTGEPDVLAEFQPIIDRLNTYQADAWGKAATYDTAVTIAGYGAFFALWAGVAKDVSAATRGATAALMGVSLLLYIGWQVASMFCRHRHDASFEKALQLPPDEGITAWTKASNDQARTLTKLQSFWLPVFAASYLTGVFGALLLIYNAAALAFGLPQFVGAI